jgi:hypothetical protein
MRAHDNAAHAAHGADPLELLDRALHILRRDGPKAIHPTGGLLADLLHLIIQLLRQRRRLGGAQKVKPRVRQAAITTRKWTKAPQKPYVPARLLKPPFHEKGLT